MTAYNRADYIESSIRSVLNQKFRDFELIIVDDCSTDDTLGVARSFESDSRVRVILNEENLGDYANRNRAARLARGEYLKYHDSDDLMYPHCLQTMYGHLDAEPVAGLALGGDRPWAGGPAPMLSDPAQSYRREYLGGGMFFYGPAGALLRRSTFERHGPWPQRGAASDGVFWLDVCRTQSVVLLPGGLFWYRVHAAQEIQSERAIFDYARAAGEFWKALLHPACPLTGTELQQARKNWVGRFGRRVLRELARGNVRVARALLSGAGLSARDWMKYFRRPRRSAHAGSPLDACGEFTESTWVTGCRKTGTALPDEQAAGKAELS